MRFPDAARLLEGIPYTSPSKGKFFYDLVLERRPKRILELGFAHGVSTCYFAAAAQALGDCLVTAVDLESSARLSPNLEQLADRLGLSGLITIRREVSSYTWFLKQEIEANTRDGVCQPKYDLIFVDGPKDWTNDGYAFFLADKLLHPGGSILFDDYQWSYRGDEANRGVRHDEGYVFKRMSEAEFAEPHIRSVFHLVVMQHPSYGDFEIVNDQMALARKTSGAASRPLRMTARFSIRYRLWTLLRGLARKRAG